MNKVVLVGCGNVGMAYAYALIASNNKVDELVLVDINYKRAYGESLDLLHASAISPRKINIKAGTYADCADATIVCICAGRNQEEGETRDDLIDKNLCVFKAIIGEINKTNFNGIYLIATNPLDVMTYVTFKLSGLPANKIIGSGTTLETARLRYLVSEELDINPKNIHAYAIGEHGDSVTVAWSSAVIGLRSATNFLDLETRNKILYDVRNSAYKIIKDKGNTAFGIGMCLKNITEAILSNSNSILTICSYDEQRDICVSLPTIINQHGVREVVDLDLTDEEKYEFEQSCHTIRTNIDSIKHKCRL